MRRINPGPFEPLVYFIQRPQSFRVITVGGLALFSLIAFSVAAGHGIGRVMFGGLLLGAFWLESSVSVCSRCRHFGTWHCGGQAIVASRLFARSAPGLSDGRVALHAALGIAYLLFVAYWVWHRPLPGVLFTIWLPMALLAAMPLNGFSWRASPRDSVAA